MEGVISGCGVVSVGVVRFGFSLWAWVFGRLLGRGVRDVVRVSFGSSVRVLTFHGRADQQMEARDIRRHEAIFGE
jgi:hypothetical protein